MAWEPKKIPTGVYEAKETTLLPTPVIIVDFTDDKDYIVEDIVTRKQHVITKENFINHYREQKTEKQTGATK
ncbi:hypothetical protein D3C73_687960 [compost metagenome]